MESLHSSECRTGPFSNVNKNSAWASIPASCHRYIRLLSTGQLRITRALNIDWRCRWLKYRIYRVAWRTEPLPGNKRSGLDLSCIPVSCFQYVSQPIGGRARFTSANTGCHVGLVVSFPEVVSLSCLSGAQTQIHFSVRLQPLLYHFSNSFSIHVFVFQTTWNWFSFAQRV